uniref:Receptor-type tyrosine-protein phosphatase U-like Fn3 domain-containing protein n=1 Tax=Sphenodon punctatus TaxID=8508 RepID=A0A8D0GVA7_SPHPU
MTFNFTTRESTPKLCLDLDSDTTYIVNITAPTSTEIFTLIFIAIQREVKEAFSNLLILNETCLKWQRSVRLANTEEIYLFHIQGQRWYQKKFFHEMTFNFTTRTKTPEVCLDLHAGTNYTVNITTTTLDLSVLVPMTTNITDPPFPDIKFVTVEGPVPLLTLRKAEDINGPISFYQVIVLPLSLQNTFTCDSSAALTFFSNVTNTEGYVAAEFLAEDVADNMAISLGDRHYYGKFYNAPLKRGKYYCIILRIISEWNKVRTQSCAVWAQIKDLSPTLQYMTAVGLGSVAAVFIILSLSFLTARTVHVPSATLARRPSSYEIICLSTTVEAAGARIASSTQGTERVSFL